MSSQTLILSDLHLGRPHCSAGSAEALRPLWQDCSHLVLNGDVAEIHHPVYRADAARQLLRLADLCEEDGVELTILSGNHDPYLSDIRHLLLADGQIFVTHGDVLHPAVAPWSPQARHMRKSHREAVESLPAETRDLLESRLAVSQHASHAEWEAMEKQAVKSTVLGMMVRPWAVVQVLWYWHRFPKLAAEFMQQHVPQARIGIFGHTHRPGIWHINGRTIINTGSFGFPGKPWAVAIDNLTSLTVMNVELNGRTFAMSTASRLACSLTLTGRKCGARRTSRNTPVCSANR